MRADAFDYELPEDRIAQTPVEPRDAARLLVDRGDAAPPEHRSVRDLPDLLRAGDLLVVNETRVLPARLHLRRATGGAAEVLLLEPVDGGGTWLALVKPGRKLRDGEVLVPAGAVAASALQVEVGARVDGGRRIVRLRSDGPLDEVLEQVGEVPLPPYVHAAIPDPQRYQTVYAAKPGSVAAPTAGLHLTREVLDRCAAKGIGLARVELVVGLDTFRPVTAERLEDHVMHSERYDVPDATLEACRAAERVVAVGTTSVRALESAAARGALRGRTDLFITPGFDWQVVDVLLTNFHLPRSTLLAMVEGFVGPRWRRHYATALSEGYRFLSFGDALLLDRHAR